MSANLLLPFYARARKHPGRPAIIEGRGPERRSLSFGELAERVPRLANGLEALGLKTGDRVLVFVPMSLELYELLMACFHLGLSAVFLDAWSSPARLDAALRLADPKAMFGSPKAQWLRLKSRAVRRIPLHLVVSRDWFPIARLRTAHGRQPVECPPGQEALVTFTTGSTGLPKGSPRSHGALAAQGKALLAAFGPGDGAVDLPTLPAFVLLNLGQGVSSVLPDFDPQKPAEVDPVRILAQIRDENVASSSGSPAFFETLAQAGPIPVQRLFTGGAAVFPSLAKKLKAACGGQVYVVYGSTEAEPIAHAKAEDLIRFAGLKRPGLFAGFPKGLKLKILKAVDGPITGTGKGMEMGPGQCGEIVVAGPHVQKGYLNDPEAEKRNKIKVGSEVWHRTGDAGYLDSEGRLFLMGRLNQRVLRAGKTWWALEAEQRALRVPGISFAVYLGLPDQRLGQRSLLCVEGRSGKAALDKALEPWPVDELRCFERLPRDPRHASKIDMEALKILLQGRP